MCNEKKTCSFHQLIALSDKCSSLPPLPNIKTDVKFPVVIGTRVKVECQEGYTLEGDNVITCVEGTHYNITASPTCKIGM